MAIHGSIFSDLSDHRGWFLRHWRGQAGWVELLGVNLLGLCTFFWILAEILAGLLARRAMAVAEGSQAAGAPLARPDILGLDPVAAMALGGFGVLILLGLVWLGVGCWRKARMVLGTVSGPIEAFALLVLAGVAAAFLASLWITALATQIPAEAVQTANSEPEKLRIDPRSGTILLFGEIDYAMANQLEDALRAHPTEQPAQIALASEGGNVFAARVIAAKLEAVGADTRAVGPCYSACALIFLSGSKRRLDLQGSLGFHAYAIAGEIRAQLTDVAAEEARDRAYYKARGVRDEFVDRAFDTPHSQIWKPARATLVKAGVLREN